MGKSINILEQLVASLSDEERASLQTLTMTTSERQYLKATLRDLSPVIQNNSTSKKLSKTHSYKIRSKLANIIVTKLAGNDELDKLQFLRQKKLRSHLVRYIQIAEKRMLPKLNGLEKEVFYRRLLQLQMPWSRDHFDDELFCKYARKYAEARVVELADEDLYIEAQLYKFSILKSVIVRDAKGQLQKKLLELHAKLSTSPHIEGRHCILRTLVEYSLALPERDLTSALHYSEAAIEVMNENPYYYTAEQIQTAKLMNTELLVYNGEYESAYQQYKTLFIEATTQKKMGSIDESSYFYCCLYTNRFDEAEVLLANAGNGNGILQGLEIYDLKLAQISFYLLTKELNAAIALINEILQHECDKNFPYYLEFYLRALEVSYYVMLGDSKFAETLIKRHLKFSEYHSKKESDNILPTFLRLAQAINLECQGVKTLQPQYIRKIEAFRTVAIAKDAYCLYLLVLKMRNLPQHS